MNQASHQGGPRLRERLREETARAILEAAEAVISEEGLGAGMERIADRAGVAVGTLYNHFHDRKALVDALSCSRRAQLFERIEAALAAGEGRPVREQLRALFAALGEHAKVHGRFLAALAAAGEGPARWKPNADIQDGLIARAGILFDRCIASGELRPEGRAVYAPALVAILRLLVHRVLQGHGRLEDLAEPLVELVLHGAAAPAGERGGR